MKMKMKMKMKKKLIPLGIFVGLVVLSGFIGCSGDSSPSPGLSDADKVQGAKDALNIQEAAGGDLLDVTGTKISLPTTGANGTTITWRSSDEKVIAIVGNTAEVTRPAIEAGDMVVDLTATITLNQESTDKTFKLKVRKISGQESINAAGGLLTEIVVEAAGGDLLAVTGTDISLPTTGVHGTSITWTSNNDAITIDPDGTATVDRSAIDTDKTIILTATISRGNTEAKKSFTLIVLADRAPGAPAISGSFAHDGKVDVSWTAPTDTGIINNDGTTGTTGTITKYTVYWGDSTGFTRSDTKKADVTDATTYTIEGLTNGEEVFFIVTATNKTGESAASTESSATPSATVVLVTGVTIDPPTTTDVTMGGTLQLSATVEPYNAADKNLTWSSADPNVATVNNGGVVTPVAVGGPVAITVTSGVGTISDTIDITVKAIAITSIGYGAITGTVNTAIISVSPTIDPQGATGNFAVTGGSLPSGLSLDPDTGEISGIPDQATTGAVSVTVGMTGNGNYAGTVTEQVDITIAEANRAPGSPAISGSFARDGEVDVSWTAPTDTGIIDGDGTTGTITKYTVYWGASGVDTNSTNKADVTDATTYTIEELTNGEEVFFIVTATNDFGESAASIESSATPATTPVSVTGVTIDPPTTTDVTMGETLQLSATVEPNDAANKNLTWSSADPNVATVNNGGVVTPVAVGGPVAITVTSGVGTISATIDITVKAITINSIDYVEITGMVNTAITSISPTIVPLGATGTFTVTSGSLAGLNLAPDTGEISGTPATATSGLVTIEMAGTGDYLGEKVTKDIGITIVDPDRPPNAPAISGSIVGDGQVEVSWTASDKGITGYTVYWGDSTGFTRSDTKKADVTDTTYTIEGLTNDDEVFFIVTATNAAGESAASPEGSATPSATEVDVTSVAIDDKTTTDVTMGGTLQLSATVEPVDATDKRLTWSSGDTSKATVDASGLVTPVAVGGPITITVTSAADSNMSDSIDITVNAITINSIDYGEITGTKDVAMSVTPTIDPQGATGSFAVTGGTLPPGLSLDPDTGKISGTPDQATTGAVSVTIEMTGTGNYFEEKVTKEVGITIYEADRVPGAPAISGSTAEDGQVVVNWTVPSDTGIINGDGTPGTITKYTVYWGDSTGFTRSDTKKADVTDTTYTIEELTNGDEVFFIVTATNAAGESAASPEGSATPSAIVVPVTSVAIDDKTTTDVTMGGTLQLSATVVPDNATNKQLTWSSNNPDVATVDNSGLVTAVAVGGPVTITVTSVADSSMSDSIDITVNAIIDSIDYGEITGTKDVAMSVTPTTNPQGATGSFALTSGTLPPGLILDPVTGGISGTPDQATTGAVSVTIEMTGTGDYTGTVTGQVEITIHVADRAPGVPVIIGSVARNGEVAVSWTAPGDTGIIGGDGTTGDITKYTVYWGDSTGFTPSDDKKADVTDTIYIITGLTNGDEVFFIVTATNTAGESAASTEGSATPTLATTSVSVTGVTIDPPTTTDVTMGGTLQLSATVEPVDATDKRLTWSSGDTSKATVDASGLVTPVALGGPITITVTSADDGTKSDNIGITVKAPIIINSIDYGEITGTKDVTMSVTPTIDPQGATGTFVVTEGTLPFGLSLNRNTGEISGIPYQATTGAVSVTIEMTGTGDYFEEKVTKEVTIEVEYGIGSTGPAGGKVFYVKDSYSDGWRYLEAATSDQATQVQWGGHGTSVGTTKDIGSGKTNTEDIVNKLGSGNYAARICYDLVLGGHDDWFLPSKDELNELHKQRDIVGSFASKYYWSSSEDSANYAWSQYIANGGQATSKKSLDLHVRAVRAF